MTVITMSCQSQYVRMFDGVSLKCMLTWHTDYLENRNLALHFENVADPCSISSSHRGKIALVKLEDLKHFHVQDPQI